MYLDTIKRLKKQLGLTNEELSVKAGLPLGTLNKILSGSTADPKLSTLLALSRVLDCTLDYLIYGARPGEPTDRERDLLARYARLDGHGRQAVDTILALELGRLDEDDGGKD